MKEVNFLTFTANKISISAAPLIRSQYQRFRFRQIDRSRDSNFLHIYCSSVCHNNVFIDRSSLETTRALPRLHRELSTNSCGFSTWFTAEAYAGEEERKEEKENERAIDDVTHLRLIAAISLRGAPARSTSEIRTTSRPGRAASRFIARFTACAVADQWSLFLSLSVRLRSFLLLRSSSLFSVKEARPAEQGHGRTSSAILSLSFSLLCSMLYTHTTSVLPAYVHSLPSRCILVKLDFTVRRIWAIVISREPSLVRRSEPTNRFVRDSFKRELRVQERCHAIYGGVYGNVFISRRLSLRSIFQSIFFENFKEKKK